MKAFEEEATEAEVVQEEMEEPVAEVNNVIDNTEKARIKKEIKEEFEAELKEMLDEQLKNLTKTQLKEELQKRIKQELQVSLHAKSNDAAVEAWQGKLEAAMDVQQEQQRAKTDKYYSERFREAGRTPRDNPASSNVE